MMVGWKTVLFNGLLAALMAFLTFVAAVDWTQYVSPSWAIIITNGINILLRFVTNTPALKKE